MKKIMIKIINFCEKLENELSDVLLLIYFITRYPLFSFIFWEFFSFPQPK